MTEPCVVGRGFTPTCQVPLVAAHLNWTDPCGGEGVIWLVGKVRIWFMCQPHAEAVARMLDVVQAGPDDRPLSTSDLDQPPPG